VYSWQYFNNLTKAVSNIARFLIAVDFLRHFILILLGKNQIHKNEIHLRDRPVL